MPSLLIRRRRLPLLALLIVALVAALPGAAGAEPPRSVTIEDSTGVVDDEQLAGDLAEVDFRRPVDVSILVVDVTDHDISPETDTALNDAVLARARDRHPDWIAPEGEVWADGRVIIALDPDNRFVGTYAGEDVALSGSQFESIQEDMGEEAADGAWEAALRTGTERYAALLGRPWWQHPGLLVVGLLVAGVAVVVVIGVLEAARRARRRIDRALPRYQDVQGQRRLTDAAAASLPPHSAFAETALADHHEYLAGIDEAERLHQRLPQRRGWTWGLTKGRRELAREFSTTVERLDDLDDGILAASDLLHRIGDWRGAWERELEPLRDSIDALDEALDAHEPNAAEEAEESGEPGEPGEGDSPDPQQQLSATELATSQQLRVLCRRVEVEMTWLTQQLDDDAITPESALESLDELTGQLSAAAVRLRDLSIDRRADDEDERTLMLEADETAGALQYGTLRERHHARRASPAASFWHISPVLWLSSWRSDSGSAIEAHRNPGVAGGATSGYSPAAGGFSGAGSSSSF